MALLNRSNIAIVLVEPRFPENIGAVARAMTNMGFDDLRLVNPLCDPFSREARRLASNSARVLEASRIFPALDQAVADCATLVATSHKPKRYKKPSYPAREIGSHLIPFCRQNKAAILFGRENHGLSNDEVKQCPWVVYIPAAVSHPSLNIAQAVFAVCYELFLASSASPAHIPKLVSHEAMENFYTRVLEMLDAAGFPHKNDDPSIFLSELRRIFSRTGLDQHELDVLFKFFDQFQHLIRKREEMGHDE